METIGMYGHMEAPIIGRVLWVYLYYSHNKEPQKSIGSYFGPCII